VIAALLVAAVSCVPLPICLDNGNVSPCATPTPTLMWDQVPDADLAGYDIAEGEPGGPLLLIQTIPCDTELESPGVLVCRGSTISLAIQRVCTWCEPNTLHEFSVVAYDTAGNRSLQPSNIVSVCFSPVCTAPGPCS
jgi:hypothetical protein